MSIIVAELYDALRAAGVDDDKAKAAAAAVAATRDLSGLVTKTDLAELHTDIMADLAEIKTGFVRLEGASKADLSALRADLMQWTVGVLIAMTAIFGVIVKLL